MPRRIARATRNAWREVEAHDSGVLIDAADYYRALVAAMRKARRYILMSGWQFDSGVKLLRGSEAPDGRAVKLLRFLRGLCGVDPELRVFILAWDFHMVFALEREWMQRIIFHWFTPPGLRFRFDHTVPEGSHHQKLVIDGSLAFVGGIDVCESRWDNRCHLEHNPLRRSRGRMTKPYHDVQACLVGGEAPRALTELFTERWQQAGGKPLCLPPAVDASWALPGEALRIGPARVALSRTEPAGLQPAVREIETLIVDAIEAAERLIYIETQYFSSTRIAQALRRRMTARDRPALEIVIVVNERGEAIKEEIAVGLRQVKILEDLREIAAATGHALGLYFSRGQGAHDVFPATYIHSKLLIVDDRFLAVGSANLTNRSMGVDRELQVSWETAGGASDDRSLGRAIRRIRISLLAEHSGTAGFAALRLLATVPGLVAHLDRLAAVPGSRLQCHGLPTRAQRLVMDLIDPEDLPFDPGFAGGDRGRPQDEPRHRRGGALRRAATAVWRRRG
jgi:phospholipase D1/2